MKRGYIWGKKTKASFETLGYTPKQVKEHIERKFIFGMSWKNYGIEWDVDHIKPVSWFNIKKWGDREMLKCWSLDNLQPRFTTTAIADKYGGFQEGNVEKGNRYAG